MSTTPTAMKPPTPETDAELRVARERVNEAMIERTMETFEELPAMADVRQAGMAVAREHFADDASHILGAVLAESYMQGQRATYWGLQVDWALRDALLSLLRERQAHAVGRWDRAYVGLEPDRTSDGSTDWFDSD